MRILVTGSRTWAYPFAVIRELQAIFDASRATEPVVVVHGACKTGADVHAAGWVALMQAEGWVVGEEVFPADWKRHGPGAGPIRNAAMVAAGADVCLAFIAPCTKQGCPRGPESHDSHGTTDCVSRARAAGIEIREVRQQWLWPTGSPPMP